MSDLGSSNSVLLEKLDSRYELAEVLPVFLRQNVVQERGTVAKNKY